MLLKLTKNNNKLHIIKYIRDNGTTTWMYGDDFFVRHDLSHYAIEKTVGFTTAFNGMINNGMDINDFEDREKRNAMHITDEAWYAENMANLFLMEMAQGQLDDFNAVQQDAFASLQTQFSKITLAGGMINRIRTCLLELLQKWDELPASETIELPISV